MADARPSHTPPKPLGPWAAAVRVFDLSLSEMLWSRRTIFMALVVGLPVLVAVGVRIAYAFNHGAVRVNNVAIDGPAIFSLIFWICFIRFTVPILGVFYGTALIADEVDDKTITYLFSRPIPRSAVLAGKYLAYLACTGCVVLPSVAIVWVTVTSIGGSLAGGFIDVLKDLVLLAIGLAVYGSLFALVGAWFKRPLIAGLVFVFAWEQFALIFPGYLKNLTIAYYLQALVPQAMPRGDLLSLIQGMFQTYPGTVSSLIVLAVMGVGMLLLAMAVVGRREYVLEQ